MILTYAYRLLPTKRQHRALETILESQRQLYNAALEERIDAYRKANITRTYFDQTKALTEWRRDDPEAAALPVNVQRATLKRLDEAYKAFFRRLKSGGKPGFPRFRGKGWFDSFGFREFRGISLKDGRIRFKSMPGALRVHLPQGRLAKDVHDASWTKFISMLRYKAEKAGARLIEVDPRNTTQDCSGCGVKVPKNLGDRQHVCPHCGLSIDRDLNAARNILYRAGVGPGLRNVAGCGMRAGGNLNELRVPYYDATQSN